LGLVSRLGLDSRIAQPATHFMPPASASVFRRLRARSADAGSARSSRQGLSRSRGAAVQRCGLGQVVRGHHKQPGIDRPDLGAPALVDGGLDVLADATSPDGAWEVSP